VEKNETRFYKWPS